MRKNETVKFGIPSCFRKLMIRYKANSRSRSVFYFAILCRGVALFELKYLKLASMFIFFIEGRIITKCLKDRIQSIIRVFSAITLELYKQPFTNPLPSHHKTLTEKVSNGRKTLLSHSGVSVSHY